MADTLSYQKGACKTKVFRHFDGERELYFSLTKLDDTFAKICGTDKMGHEALPLDNNYTLYGDEAGPTRKLRGGFIVTWFDDYHMLYKGNEIFTLKNPKEQTIHPKAGCQTVHYS